MALKDFKSLTKDTLIYGIGNASDRIIRFVLLPLYSAYLPVASYGIRNLTIPLYEILKIVILLSIEEAVIADFYKAKTPEERRTVISTGFTFSVITSLLIGASTFFLAAPLAQILGLDFPQAPAILRLFAISTALFPPGFVFLSFLRCEKRAVMYSMFTVAKSLVKVGLMIVALAVLKRDLIGVYEVDVVMAVVFFIPVTILIYIYTKGVKFSFKSLRSMFGYSLPLVPNRGFFWVRNMLDRWLIKPVLGEGAVGVYGFAVNIANLVSFLLVATVNLAWIPYAFSIKEREDLPKIVSRILTYMLFIGGWALIVLGGCAKELVQIIAKKPEYWEGYPLIPILLLGICLYGAYSIISTPCHIKRRTGFFTLTSLVGAAVIVLINIILLPRIGLWAAAVASVSSYAAMLAAMILFSRRLMKMPYETKRILLVSLASLGITAGSFFWHPLTPLFAFLIKLAGGSILYIGILLLSGFLLPSEREFLLRRLKKKRGAP